MCEVMPSFSLISSSLPIVASRTTAVQKSVGSCRVRDQPVTFGHQAVHVSPFEESIMNTRQAWIIGMCLVIGCAFLGFLWNPTAAQTQVRGPAWDTLLRGRFELFTLNRNEMILLDSTTGRCWQYLGIRLDGENKKHQEWVDLDTPPARPGAK
jgi:hypothetical protein